MSVVIGGCSAANVFQELQDGMLRNTRHAAGCIDRCPFDQGGDHGRLFVGAKTIHNQTLAMNESYIYDSLKSREFACQII
jgi:hypothetical protein